MMAQSIALDPTIHTTGSMPRDSKNNQRSQYVDKNFMGGLEAWNAKLAASTTVYVGNLSRYTNEFQIYQVFSQCGSVKRIIMGLDKNTKKPCGFCFVEYEFRISALKSVELLNGVYIDMRPIRVNMDAGFMENRQFGRGSSGGQRIDDRPSRRSDYDHRGPRGGDAQPMGPAILTRSFTIVACMTIIAMIMISCQPDMVHGLNDSSPYDHGRRFDRNQYMNPLYVRRTQMTQFRQQFENQFAQLLVTIMKAAKPTLLKAFIKATLADKQLKDVALAIFFNNTSSESETI